MGREGKVVRLADGLIRLGPLEQAKGQAKVPIHPGADRHGAAWVIEALSPVPIENISVGFAAIAGQAGRHAVFSDAQSALGAGVNVINGFGRIAAVNATLSGKSVK